MRLLSVPRMTLFAVTLWLAVISFSDQAGGRVAAYVRRGGPGAGYADPNDRFAGLTEYDLRADLRDRGVEAPEDASFAELVRMARELDRQAELQERAAATDASAAAIGIAAGQRPKVRVLYCVGWGYRNAFGELATALQQHFGDHMIVEGDNYPAPALNQLISSLLSYAAVGGFLLALLAPQMLPLPVRRFVQENKGMCFMALFLVNSVSGALVQTGAFEVDVDGAEVFSKLKSGEAPSVARIVAAISEHLRAAAQRSPA